ncbi:MAG: ferredoxin [Candidatus Thermoplasmatota archaeon]
MVNVVIDQDTCIECGQCYAICPEVFQDDGTGTAELVDEYQGSGVFEGKVPEDIECTENAVEACPVDAIKAD